MIEFIQVVKKYSNKKNKEFLALNDINLKINQGEIFGIIGKSGAGKSTFLRCANLLERPTSGHIIYNGTDLTTLNAQKLRQSRRKIGMIFQHFNLLSHSTVYNNIALPLKVVGYSKQQIKDRVDYLLQVTELSDKANYYPDELSGGQKQRVAIARAMATNPQVLLCDEATSALDVETTKSILDLLKKINKEFNMTIILITHHIEVVKYICHRVAVMEKGSFVEVQNKKDFFQHQKSAEGKSLILTQNFEHEGSV